jgi:PKD repeat protein
LGYIKKIFLLIEFILFISFKATAQDGHPVPAANYEVNNLCYKSITSFSNTSTNLENHVFEWSIRQMGVSTPIYTSSATNISFQFPVKTTYTVSLSVVNYVTSTHSHGDLVERIIFIDSIPIANFDFKACQNKFTNLSCCANSFIWDFGDSSPTSTVTSPPHTYSASNFYNPQLIASNGVQSNTFTKQIFTFSNLLTASFSYTTNPDSVSFRSDYDSLSGSGCTWNWAFGDGQTLNTFGSSGWTTKHKYPIYERDSIYTVFLLVKDLCFKSFAQKNILIKGIGKNVTSTYVFPSPIVHGYLNIESNEKDKLVEIKIIDCLGKRLDNLVPTEKPYGYYFWIDNLATGVYFVQLVFTDRVENHKIIKE